MKDTPVQIEDEYVRKYLWDRNLVAIDNNYLSKLMSERSWKDLTKDEITEAWQFITYPAGFDSFMRKINKILKEKNT